MAATTQDLIGQTVNFTIFDYRGLPCGTATGRVERAIDGYPGLFVIAEDRETVAGPSVQRYNVRSSDIQPIR